MCTYIHTYLHVYIHTYIHTVHLIKKVKRNQFYVRHTDTDTGVLCTTVRGAIVMKMGAASAILSDLSQSKMVIFIL